MRGRGRVHDSLFGKFVRHIEYVCRGTTIAHADLLTGNGSGNGKGTVIWRLYIEPSRNGLD